MSWHRLILAFFNIMLFYSKFKNVKEDILFNIFSKKPENTIVLRKVKIPKIKKC